VLSLIDEPKKSITNPSAFDTSTPDSVKWPHNGLTFDCYSSRCLVANSWITETNSSSIGKCCIDLIKPRMFSLKLNISSKQKGPKPKEDSPSED
jgi:hypothetical protein